MGRVFHYYVCKKCRTETAFNSWRLDHRLGIFNSSQLSESGHERRISKNVIDVCYDNKVWWIAGPGIPHMRVDIHCVKCMDRIGYKLVPLSYNVEIILLRIEKREILELERVAREAPPLVIQVLDPAEAEGQDQAGEIGEEGPEPIVQEPEEEPELEPEEAAVGQDQAAEVGEQQGHAPMIEVEVEEDPALQPPEAEGEDQAGEMEEQGQHPIIEEPE